MPLLPAPACLGSISQHIGADESGICPDTFGSSAPKGRRKMATRAAVTRAGGGRTAPGACHRRALQMPERGWKHILFPQGRPSTRSSPLWARRMGWKIEGWVFQAPQEPSRRMKLGKQPGGRAAEVGWEHPAPPDEPLGASWHTAPGGNGQCQSCSVLESAENHRMV